MRRRPSCASVAARCSTRRSSKAAVAPSSCPNHGGREPGRISRRPCNSSSDRLAACAQSSRPPSARPRRPATCRSSSATSSRCPSCCCCSSRSSACWRRHCASASVTEVPTNARASRKAIWLTAACVSVELRSCALTRSSQAFIRASKIRIRSSIWEPTCFNWPSTSCLSESMRCCKPAVSTETRSASWPTFVSDTSGRAGSQAPVEEPKAMVGALDPVMFSIRRDWLTMLCAKSTGFTCVSLGHGSFVDRRISAILIALGPAS
mmetsp:Transcript_94204/g.275519  ORF Transcript_94204/g.275519 Transcript_94204/m.275519 type:complete len:264 (-) Transcript_94204:113-904(-)